MNDSDTEPVVIVTIGWPERIIARGLRATARAINRVSGGWL